MSRFSLFIGKFPIDSCFKSSLFFLSIFNLRAAVTGFICKTELFWKYKMGNWTTFCRKCSCSSVSWLNKAYLSRFFFPTVNLRQSGPSAVSRAYSVVCPGDVYRSWLSASDTWSDTVSEALPLAPVHSADTSLCTGAPGTPKSPPIYPGPETPNPVRFWWNLDRPGLSEEKPGTGMSSDTSCRLFGCFCVSWSSFIN